MGRLRISGRYSHITSSPYRTTLTQSSCGSSGTRMLKVLIKSKSPKCGFSTRSAYYKANSVFSRTPERQARLSTRSIKNEPTSRPNSVWVQIGAQSRWRSEWSLLSSRCLKATQRCSASAWTLATLSSPGWATMVRLLRTASALFKREAPSLFQLKVTIQTIRMMLTLLVTTTSHPRILPSRISAQMVDQASRAVKCLQWKTLQAFASLITMLAMKRPQPDLDLLAT